MARNFTSTNYINRTNPTPPPGTGSLFLRFKPSWNSGDGVQHGLFSYSDIFDIQRFTDNNIYAGWSNGGDARIVVSDSGVFTSGVWGNHLLTWSDSANTTSYYVDNVLKGSSTTAFTVPVTTSLLQIGALATGPNGNSATGHIAEWALYDHELDSSERTVLQDTGNPACVTGLVRYYKIVGDVNPETDEIGSEDLALVGTPAQVTHPTVNSCAGATVNPDTIAETATIPTPGVDLQPHAVNPLAIAATATIPSPVLTSDPFAIAPTAIAADAAVPSPGLGFVTAKGLTVTLTISLATG